MALFIKDRKLLTKSRPSKGGRVPKLKIKSLEKHSGKVGRRFREMEICLAVQLEMDKSLLKGSFVGRFPSPMF